MEQLTLFKPPYKYIIDACSVFAQKDTDSLPRKVHKSLWESIDSYMKNHIIVTCSEIEEEVQKDDAVKTWFSNNQCVILPIDETVQYYVRKIVNDHPKMIEFSGSGSSSGDAFLIATAMKYGLTVITEENKTKLNKIPKICDAYNIRAINITELCIEEGWEF